MKTLKTSQACINITLMVYFVYHQKTKNKSFFLSTKKHFNSNTLTIKKTPNNNSMKLLFFKL